MDEYHGNGGRGCIFGPLSLISYFCSCFLWVRKIVFFFVKSKRAFFLLCECECWFISSTAKNYRYSLKSFKKIVLEHFNPHFNTTVLFESKGKKTQLDWTMLFDTAEMFETVVKAHKADEGQKQNVERLEKYLSKHFNQQVSGYKAAGEL